MENDLAIMERLERIDDLRAAEAPPGVLLAEVRSLLAEAEEWVREDPAAPRRAREAIDRSKEALAGGETRHASLVASS